MDRNYMDEGFTSTYKGIFWEPKIFNNIVGWLPEGLVPVTETFKLSLNDQARLESG